MARHVKKSSHGDYWRLAIIALTIFAAAYLLLDRTSAQTSTAHEARFADETASGLSIVPASGVSETSYYGYGQGTYYGYGQATYYGQGTYYGYGEATYFNYGYGQATYYGYGESGYQAGQSGYQAAQSSYAPSQSSYTPGTCWDGSPSSPTGVCPACPPGFTKSGLQCIPPASPQFVGFTTTQGFNASGHLEVRPSLVRPGDPSRVYWNVTNVRDCTVRGSNGDGASGSATGQWNMLGSGAAGVVTTAIGSRTDYTLFCHSLVGATPSTITETRTVNVIPRWFEPSGQ